MWSYHYVNSKVFILPMCDAYCLGLTVWCARISNYDTDWAISNIIYTFFKYTKVIAQHNLLKLGSSGRNTVDVTYIWVKYVILYSIQFKIEIY